MRDLIRYVPTPYGPFALVERDGALISAGWQQPTADETGDVSDLLDAAQDQIGAYFERRLIVFDLPTRIIASELVCAVCDLLCKIPFGETRTYGDLARDLSRPAQAIGQACGGNPIPVIVPCHRVLGANGLGGFSAPGGVETKVELLKLEGAAGLLI